MSGSESEITVLFPSDYFSLSSPNDNFGAELEAARTCPHLEPCLFNFDGYAAGEPLAFSRDSRELPRPLVYRGWMMKPAQYATFCRDLAKLGFEPLVPPSTYERMHCFPSAVEALRCPTPRFLAFPERNGRVEVDAELVNRTFRRFMFKDYVKSLKDTTFPQYVETPVTQESLDALIGDFIGRRGELFTGGIVLKEFVNLKRYGQRTNEWRQFVFMGKQVALERNSGQGPEAPEPPAGAICPPRADASPFYTVDYAELADGSWTMIEAGDGQASGLPAADDPTRFYRAISDAACSSGS